MIANFRAQTQGQGTYDRAAHTDTVHATKYAHNKGDDIGGGKGWIEMHHKVGLRIWGERLRAKG